MYERIYIHLYEWNWLGDTFVLEEATITFPSPDALLHDMVVWDLGHLITFL